MAEVYIVLFWVGRNFGIAVLDRHFVRILAKTLHATITSLRVGRLACFVILNESLSYTQFLLLYQSYIVAQTPSRVYQKISDMLSHTI